MHPKKSLIFQGTRFVPLPYLREGDIFIKEGLAPLLNTPIKRAIGGEAPRGRVGSKTQVKNRVANYRGDVII